MGTDNVGEVSISVEELLKKPELKIHGECKYYTVNGFRSEFFSALQGG